MLSDVIVLYFPCVKGPYVERTWELVCYIFRAWNALWYFVLNSFRVVLYLPCDLPVFISKLSWCKGVEFSAAFLAVFVDFSVIFYACGGNARVTHSDINLLYFLRVECALALLCYIFCVWRVCTRNAIYRYCVIFSSRGTRSGVIVVYFLGVERALVLLCYIFRV